MGSDVVPWVRVASTTPAILEQVDSRPAVHGDDAWGGYRTVLSHGTGDDSLRHCQKHEQARPLVASTRKEYDMKPPASETIESERISQEREIQEFREQVCELKGKER